MCNVKLFKAWHSPFVWRVDLALSLKGVKYVCFEEDLEDKSCDLKKYSPIHLKVPVLVHNENPIDESMVILEYIDEVWKDAPSILPEDPYARAKARSWAKFIDEKCIVPSWNACWSKNEEERQRLKADVQKAFKHLENEIEGKKFFGGDNIGLVDFAGNFIAYWLPILQEEAGIDIFNEEFKNLWAWAKRFCDEELVKKNLPNKERLACEYKKRLPLGKMYEPQFKRDCP